MKLRIAGLLAVVCAAAFCFAAITGDIEGTVYDPSGAVVADAKVTIKNLATGVSRTITTNNLGQFAALQLDLGDYEVAVDKNGFRVATQQAAVRSGEKTRLNLTLVVGSSTEITVEGGAAQVLDTATSQVNTSLSAVEVLNLPRSTRNVVDFAVLAPGTVPVSKDNPFLGSGSFNSNGSRGRANNITVDNMTSSDISTTGSSGIGTFSVESIQEFKVITNNFSAEFGRNGGSQVQIITKGGSNAFHGSAYWLHQNSYFAARDFFDTTGEATPFKQNTYGFWAGGPIVKNRMWVSGHFEGQKQRGQGSTNTATVLTPAQVAGITDATS